MQASNGFEKCGLAYKSETTKKQHEKEEHMKCSDSCQLCKERQYQEAAKQQKAAMKKNREEEEREQKRKREEEKDEAIELANTKMKEVDPAVGHIKLEVAKAAVESALCNEPWMPPIDKLVALKDVIGIPDSCWPMVMLTFKLAKGASLYYVKKRIKELNATMNVEKTEGGRGHLFPFKEFMERVIKENINKPPTSGIVKVKLSLDGSTAAARGHRQMELGTLETLHDEWSLKALKSSHNCRPWLMYLGKEDSSTH